MGEEVESELELKIKFLKKKNFTYRKWRVGKEAN